MMAEKENIQLFVKASDDGESLGNCPFCQRLFMILMQKGVPFTLTTVDMKRAPEVLKDLAPGSQPPFLLYNGEVKTDTNKIEEFLEEKLKPPSYPNMSPRYKDSSTAGDDIFQKFSAYIKNCNPQREDATTSVVPKKNRLSHGWWVYRHQPGMQQTGIPFGLPKTEKTLELCNFVLNKTRVDSRDTFDWFERIISGPITFPYDALQKNLLKSLLKLDRYLLKPQEHELSAQPGLTVSCRKFLDGDTLTLPDCSLLPKLHIVNTVCKHFRHFEIPKDLQAITRYMSNARELKEFKYTCPNTEEILLMYRPVVQPMP